MAQHVTIATAREQFIRWLADCRDLSPHTIRAYSTDIQLLERFAGPRLPLHQLDADLVTRFFEDQRGGGSAPASLRRRAASIRSFCRYVAEQRLVSGDPWPHGQVAFRRPRHLPRAIARSDLAALVTHLRRESLIPEPLCPDVPLQRPVSATTLLATALMVSTGVRVGELTATRTIDLDLAAGSIRVLGKGRKERIVYIVDDWLIALLQSYLTTRRSLNVSHSFLLINSDGAPLTPARIRARLARASRDAGLPVQVTPHMLRHTAATQLIESGVNIRFVQRLLGHASLTTTEIYTHVTDEALKFAVSGASVLTRSLGVDNWGLSMAQKPSLGARVPWLPFVVGPILSLTAFVVAYFLDPLNFGNQKSVAALPAFLLAVVVLLVSHNIAAFREVEKASNYSDRMP